MTKKGNIFLLDGDGVVVQKFSVPLLKAQVERDSAKLGETHGSSKDGVACASRPFDMELYAYAMSVNTYHMRACKVKARDIVGRGWDLVAEETDKQPNKKIRDEIMEFLATCHDEKSFEVIAECAEIDYQGLGNGYLEIRRNPLRRPAGLEHFPAKEMWIRLDGQGYIQEKQGKNAKLKRFGDEDKTDDLNEMIHMADYHPLDNYYGIPCIMTAWGRLALMQLELEYNMAFFGNQAMARWAVILEGEWEKGSDEKVKEYFRSQVKGRGHQTLCLTTPEGCKVTFQRLDTDAKDAHFRFLRKDSRDEIAQSHGTPPQKLGIVETGALGGNVGAEQMQDYKNTIVAPGQERWERVLNRIIQSGWPECGWIFKYKEFDLEDEKQNADIDNIYLNTQVLVPNEVRARRYPDLNPLPGGDAPLNQAQDMSGVWDAVKSLQKSLGAVMEAVDEPETRKSILKALRGD